MISSKWNWNKCNCYFKSTSCTFNLSGLPYVTVFPAFLSGYHYWYTFLLWWTSKGNLINASWPFGGLLGFYCSYDNLFMVSKYSLTSGFIMVLGNHIIHGRIRMYLQFLSLLRRTIHHWICSRLLMVPRVLRNKHQNIAVTCQINETAKLRESIQI